MSNAQEKKGKGKIYGRVFCDYKVIVEKLKKGGATDLELFKLQASLVRPGGFVDQQAVRAFANITANALPEDVKAKETAKLPVKTKENEKQDEE